MNDTINYYNQNASAFFEGTVNVNMGDIYRRFLAAIPRQSHILDLGCGSGRDSKFFADIGHLVIAVDGSPELCQKATEYTGFPVRCMLFDELDFHEEFDAVWACASLLHVEKSKMHDVLKLVSNALKCGGTLYVSYKYGQNQRLQSGRLFSDYTEQDIPFLFNQENNLKCLEWWITADARPDRSNEQWLNILCKKGHDKPSF